MKSTCTKGHVFNNVRKSEMCIQSGKPSGMSFQEIKNSTFARLTISNKVVIIVRAGGSLTEVRYFGKSEVFSVDNRILKEV